MAFSFSQKGYLGKKNELGVDLFNMAYQGIYELEYKRAVNKHLGIILTAGYYASKKNYEDRTLEMDPISSLTTGPTFGIGIGNNRERLGMSYPIGWCMSYGYKVSLLKIRDRYNGSPDPVRFEHTVHEIYMRFSRTYNINEHLNFQLSVRAGNLISKVEEASGTAFNDESPGPLRVLPAKHPFSEGGTYQIREFPVNNFKFRFFIMPVVRVAHLF